MASDFESEEDNYLSSCDDLWVSGALLPLDTSGGQAVQAVEDALCDILDRGGSCECFNSNTVRLCTPLPERVRTLLRADEDSTVPETLFFLLQLAGLQVWVEPFWESSMTTNERHTLAVRCNFLSTNSSPFCNLKPLVLAIQNDLELVALLREGSGGCGEPSEDAVERVRSRVEWRLSEQSELYEGVFDLKEDRERGKLVGSIVEGAASVYAECKGRNVITCVYDVILHNLKCFGERCYLCGVDHVPKTVEMAPMACCNDLCRFRSCDMSYGQLYALVRQRPKVFQLLVNLIREACTSPRAAEVLLPAPPGMCLADVRKLVLEMPGLKEFEPCNSEDDIKEVLERKGPGCYKIFWWLVANLPSHVTSVGYSEIEGIVKQSEDGTVINKKCEVFKITSLTTSLHRGHMAVNARYGTSKYLYHGSPCSNWYSILKHGPRVMSGTSYQMHGHVRGKGIYAAGGYSVARGYSKRGPHMKKQVVGIFEVVDAGGIDVMKYTSCWVISKPEFVALKYLVIE